MTLQLQLNPFPSLETERMSLRPVRMSDAPELYALRSDESVMQFIERERPATENDVKPLLQAMLDGYSDSSNATWAITLKGNDTMIGLIGFWRMDKDNYRTETGYMLGKEFHGQGLMHEAMRAVLDCGFLDFRFHTIEAVVNPDNAASIGLLEKNGFTREGYFRENCFFRGKFYDSAFYSILAREHLDRISK